jgi:hypothetical protein
MPRPRAADAVFPPERHLLRRRDFLTLGSMGLAGLWLGGLGRAEGAALAEAARAVLPAQPMSLGYFAGSEELPNTIDLPRTVLSPSSRPVAGTPAQGVLSSIVPADGLSGGDTGLVGQTFQMKVHGLYPPKELAESRRAAMPLAVDLDILFPPPDPIFPKKARFLAWSFRRKPGWDPSPPTKFVFPLDWQALPEIEMKVTPADGETTTVLTTRFTLDAEPGRPRLRRGVYLLGLAPDSFEWDISLAELARVAPLERLAVMISFETYPVGT